MQRRGWRRRPSPNHFVAMEYDLSVVPVINKIDLPAADPERVREEIDEELGLDPFEVVLASAKKGEGIEEVLDAIVHRIPPPGGDPEDPLRALIFDAQYDTFRGVVLLVRVVDGEIRRGDRVRLMRKDREYVVEEVGLLRLRREPVDVLSAGAVGYAICGIKRIQDIAIGDTVIEAARPAEAALPGYRQPRPVVFSSVYPISTDDYGELENAPREAGAQRSGPDLRARVLHGPRIRVPLRIPGTPAPGRGAGAAAAGTRAVAAPFGSQRALPDHHPGRGTARGRKTRPTTRTRRSSTAGRSPTSGLPFSYPSVRWER